MNIIKYIKELLELINLYGFNKVLVVMSLLFIVYIYYKFLVCIKNKDLELLNYQKYIRDELKDELIKIDLKIEKLNNNILDYLLKKRGNKNDKV